jgi:protein-tyrosine-phosphatase
MAPEQRTEKKRVLIFWTGNSATSQMAEGLLRHDAGEYFEVESAGTRPDRVRPEAVAVLREVGIDISQHRLKHIDELSGLQFDFIITVDDKLANPARSSSGTGKSDTAISKTQRRSLARRNNGSTCFDGSGTTYAGISESSL